MEGPSAGKVAPLAVLGDADRVFGAPFCQTERSEGGLRYAGRPESTV
jgi:hypothetical protein